MQYDIEVICRRSVATLARYTIYLCSVCVCVCVCVLVVSYLVNKQAKQASCLLLENACQSHTWQHIKWKNTWQIITKIQRPYITTRWRHNWEELAGPMVSCRGRNWPLLRQCGYVSTAFSSNIAGVQNKSIQTTKHVFWLLQDLFTRKINGKSLVLEQSLLIQPNTVLS